MDDVIAVVGVPSALGGQLPGAGHHGMAAAPGELRRRGLLERLRASGLRLRDDGDVAVEPAYRDDADPRAKNRAAIADYLPREAAMVAGSVAGSERLLILGGDCCAHAGAMSGLRRARRERRSPSPGSTRTATSTRPTRRRRGTSGACRSRCSVDVASGTWSGPATARRSR